MVAAVVGAAAPIPLTSPVQDESYLLAGADRFTRIAAGEQTDLFPYPDLLRWRPPRSGLDSVGLADDRLALAGLGCLTPQGPAPYRPRWDLAVDGRIFGPRLVVKAPARASAAAHQQLGGAEADAPSPNKDQGSPRARSGSDSLGRQRPGATAHRRQPRRSVRDATSTHSQACQSTSSPSGSG